MEPSVRERAESWIEIPSVWADDQTDTEPIRFVPGVEGGRVSIQTGGEARHRREVSVADVRAALVKIEEEHQR